MLPQVQSLVLDGGDRRHQGSGGCGRVCGGGAGDVGGGLVMGGFVSGEKDL